MTSDADSPAGLGPGSRFAGCVIERELGHGGAGLVFLARDESLDRLVAIKVLHGIGMSEETSAQERFRNEALVAARLEHPAMVPIYATGVERGLTYLVMRYIPGRSLADILEQEATMNPVEVLRLLRPIADALDFANDHDFVHRDVKPGNILIDESVTPRRAYLGDFGIARAFEGTRHTATGSWVGTPDYIAPEVFKDEIPTGAADQYALACVVIECMSGAPPFRRSNTASTIAAQIGEAPSLEALSGIGTPAHEILEVALDKDPNGRFASCTEFIDALQQTIRADAKATPNTVVRRRKRHRKLRKAIAIGGAVAGAIGLFVGVSDWAGFSLRDMRSGGSSGSSTAAVATPATPGKQAEIIIFGTELEEGEAAWSSSAPSGDSLQVKKGTDFADILVHVLRTQPETASLVVSQVPLKDETKCPVAISDALATPPSRAIVVLESLCTTLVLRAVNALPDPPITYVLANSSNEGLTSAPQLITAPAALTKGAAPSAVAWRDSLLGGPPRAPFVRMRPGSLYDVGTVARSAGYSQCNIVMGAPTDGLGANYDGAAITNLQAIEPLIALGTATQEAELDAGMRSADGASTGPTVTWPLNWRGVVTQDVAFMKTLTGNAADDEELFNWAATHPGECWVLPAPTTDFPFLLPLDAFAARSILDADASAGIYLLGNPYFDHEKPGLWTDKGDAPDIRFLRRHATWIQTLPWAAVETPVSAQFASTIADYVANGIDPQSVSDRWALAKTAVLIGKQGDAKRPDRIAIPPEQWRPLDAPGIPGGWSRYNASEATFGSDVVVVQTPSDHFYKASGPPELLAAP